MLQFGTENYVDVRGKRLKEWMNVCRKCFSKPVYWHLTSGNFVSLESMNVMTRVSRICLATLCNALDSAQLYQGRKTTLASRLRTTLAARSRLRSKQPHVFAGLVFMNGVPTWDIRVSSLPPSWIYNRCEEIAQTRLARAISARNCTEHRTFEFHELVPQFKTKIVLL